MKKRNEPKICHVALSHRSLVRRWKFASIERRRMQNKPNNVSDLSLPKGEAYVLHFIEKAKQTQFSLFPAQKQGSPKKQSQILSIAKSAAGRQSQIKPNPQPVILTLERSEGEGSLCAKQSQFANYPCIFHVVPVQYTPCIITENTYKYLQDKQLWQN